MSLRAATREEAEDIFDFFLEAYGPKYTKAAECLRKGREELLVIYGFPADHWRQIRTTNSVESTFATVRSRTGRERGSFLRETALAMVFRLARKAERSWRRLNGSTVLKDVAANITYTDELRFDRIAA